MAAEAQCASSMRERKTAPRIMARRDSMAALFARLNRTDLELIAEIAIDRIDTLAGDPDVEANGDELDGTAAEDDFYPHSHWRQEPGCPVGDPGGEDERYSTLPIFGIDQTAGPINEHEASRVHFAPFRSFERTRGDA